MRFPPKQPTKPIMPTNCSPVVINRPEPANKTPQNKRSEYSDGTIPLILDNKVIGVCKKLGSGYIDCIIWDRCLTYEYLAEGLPDKKEIHAINIKH